MGRVTTRLVALAGAGVIAGVIAPAMALAAPAPTVVRVGPEVTGAPGPQISVASCLPGEEAVGGGYDTGGATANTIVHTSRPIPNGAGATPTGWESQVTNGVIQSFVVCVPASWGNPQVRQQLVQGSGTVRAMVFCPAATDRATGGGFDTNAATANTIVHTSRPIHDAGGVRGWDVVVTNGAPVTAYVICVDEGTTTFTTRAKSVPSGGGAATSVACPGALTATGGGFDTNGADAGDIVNTSRPTPHFSGQVPKGWEAYFTGTTGTVFVVCTQ